MLLIKVQHFKKIGNIRQFASCQSLFGYIK